MINLEKGQRISMEKGLKKVGVGLGWDPNEGTGYDFDLDASAFMLGKNGKCPKDEYFVFYNNQVSPDGSVASSGDDQTGGNSDGGVRNSYIRIYDAQTDEEIARYDLDEDFSVETAVEFGRLYRHNGQWKFEAIANGSKGGMQSLVNQYID